MPRIETIMDAVETALINLPTTKGNVKRARIYPWQESELPALSIFMGADDVISELIGGNSILDWGLVLIVESHVQEKGDIDQKLNTIRKEVHAALMTDPTQGQSFVISTYAVNAAEPQLSGDGQQPIASQRLQFLIYYRTSRTAIDA